MPLVPSSKCKMRGTLVIAVDFITCAAVLLWLPRYWIRSAVTFDRWPKNPMRRSRHAAHRASSPMLRGPFHVSPRVDGKWVNLGLLTPGVNGIQTQPRPQCGCIPGKKCVQDSARASKGTKRSIWLGRVCEWPHLRQTPLGRILFAAGNPDSMSVATTWGNCNLSKTNSRGGSADTGMYCVYLHYDIQHIYIYIYYIYMSRC